jgi:hypothetical protein
MIKTLAKKRFWISLVVFGFLNYTIFWNFIPQYTLSGNPGADGTVVYGFPFIVKTSGGCNFGGSCMDFNMLHFWLNVLVIVAFTLVITIVFQKEDDIWESLKNITHFSLAGCLYSGFFLP